MFIISRPKLRYPGGTPAFVQSHVASEVNVFSFVGGGRGGAPIIVNAPNVSVRPTIALTPTTVIDGNVGPMSYNDASGAITVAFNGFSTANFSAVTIAVIARLDQVTGGTQIAFSDDNGNNFGAGMILYTVAGGVQIRLGGQAVSPLSAPPSLSMGVPYFVIFTGKPNGTGLFLVKNLKTGARWYGATDTMPATFNGGGGSLYVANNSGTFANLGGGVAAGMRSNSALTLPEMLAWSETPWEFWYPTSLAISKTLFKSAAAAGITVLLGDAAIDFGLSAMVAGADKVHICSAEPMTYANVGTFTLGNKNLGAGGVFGALAAGAPNGRKTVVAAFSGGSVTATGTAVWWAIVDSANSRLYCKGQVASSLNVTSGNTFSLATFTVHQPNV